MSTKKSEKNFNDLLFDYQTRLQGVANDLGDKLARLISTTDADVLKLIVKELPRREKDVRAEIRRLERLIKKIEKTRAPGFSLARDLAFQTARDVAELSSDQTVSEATAARREADFLPRKPRPKKVDAATLSKIVDYQPVEGWSIAGWFDALSRSDMERIANVVTRAAVEGLTVSAVAREIRGTKENGYADGILQTTRNGAVKLARTMINGVSNNARIETIKENADAIDGARFVGTLDGKTCPHCGALDGTVWGPDKLDQIRRPPLHISCRCCVVPHVKLRGPDGEVFEIGSRPAANADFDALAKEAYNKAARQRKSARRWDDLSPSTRLKYYYKAQKDFEERTGKPAYRQVSPSTTFAEYFERQDDAFKRSWLGAKRYEAYRNGATFGDLVKPAATYRATTAELSPTPAQTPELVLPRLEGTPRQISWAEDLRRRAVRDLTEELTTETARDYLRLWRNWSSRRDGKRFRDALPELEKAIAEVGGDDAAAQILGRETLLKACEYVEAWDDSRDWIDLKTEQKVGLNAYAAQKIAGTPKEAAAILRRYADEAKAVEGPLTREKLEALIEEGFKDRRDGFDKIFPLDDSNSENRVKMRQKYPTKAGKIRASKETNAPLLSSDAEKSLKTGLDFVGRALDNIAGEGFKNRGFWKTHFRAYCERTGRYCSDGSIILRDNHQNTIGENVAHEFAHALERNAPGLLSRLQALYVDLTTEESGERTPLTCENPAAPTDERRYFRALAQQHQGLNIPAYALRSYEKQQTEPASELLSMWLQKIFENPNAFCNEYHEYYKKIDGVLKEWKKTL